MKFVFLEKKRGCSVLIVTQGYEVQGRSRFDPMVTPSNPERIPKDRRETKR